jgi:hypothetical protein
MRLDARGAALLARAMSDRRASTRGRRASTSSRIASPTEPLTVTRTTAMNASEWPTACSHLVASFKATEASSSSPTLEGKATLKSFLRRLPGSILDGELPPTYMLPALLGICRSERRKISSNKSQSSTDRRLHRLQVVDGGLVHGSRDNGRAWRRGDRRHRPMGAASTSQMASNGRVGLAGSHDSFGERGGGRGQRSLSSRYGKHSGHRRNQLALGGPLEPSRARHQPGREAEEAESAEVRRQRHGQPWGEARLPRLDRRRHQTWGGAERGSQGGSGSSRSTGRGGRGWEIRAAARRR